MSREHRILVLTYWSFDDALVQTYTIPYLRIIKKMAPGRISIHLVTQEKDHAACTRVAQHSDPDFTVLPLPYHPFGPRAILSWLKNLSGLRKYIREKQINTLHSWCTPAGMIAYLLYKKTRLRFIADSFEPHAEAMVENGTWKKNSAAFKLLFRYEKKIAQQADEVICIAPGMEQYALEKYGVQLKHPYVKPACADLEKFSSAHKKKPSLLEENGLTGKIVCLYAGKFGGIYLEEEVFDFFSTAYGYWKDKVKFLLLTNEKQERLNALIARSGVPQEQFVIRFVPHAQVADWMGLADFALCPVKPVPTKKFCSPIKTGEYWAMGLPVIITQNISSDSALIAQHNAGYVWKALNPEEYLHSVKYMDALLKEKDPGELYASIRQLAEKYRSFSIAEKIYREIYR